MSDHSPTQRLSLLLTRYEAAQQLRISLPFLDKLISGGAITAVKVGRRVLIPENEIVNLINKGGKK